MNVAVAPPSAAPDLRLVDGHSKMAHALTADAGVTDAEFRLISAIRRYDWRDGICRASQSELAAACAKEERTVRHLIRTLKRKQLLVEENDPARAGRARIYRLIGKLATTPQTGQHWPVYDPETPAQIVKDRPDKPADPSQIKWPISAGLKKTPEDRPEDVLETSPESPGTPGPAPIARARDAADGAASTTQQSLHWDVPPRPAPKPKPLPVEQLAQTPPPPPTPAPAPAGRTVGRRPRTDPPETIEPSVTLRAFALKAGFTDETIAGEIELCLDWHRVNAKLSGDWQASLRMWLKNEIGYAVRDGRQPGVHVAPSRQGDRAHFLTSNDPARAAIQANRQYDGSRHGGLPDDMRADAEKGHRF